MNRDEKDHITSNKYRLSDFLDFGDKLTDYLTETKVIGSGDVEKMHVAYTNKGRSGAIAELLRILTTKIGGYTALALAANELQMTGASEILERLPQDKWTPLPIDSNSTQSWLAASAIGNSTQTTNMALSKLYPDTFVWNGIFYSVPIHNIQGLPDVALLEVEKNENEDGNCTDVMFDNMYHRKKLDVVIDKAPTAGALHQNKEVSYELPIEQRRLALIINMKLFDNPDNQARGGSDIDVEHLTTLLEELDFEVHPRLELQKGYRTKEDVEKRIRDFQEKCNKVRPSIAVIFIGSHGANENKIITSDDKPQAVKYLKLYADIVKPFDDKNCPGLEGKPKIFLVQACQSIHKDYADGDEDIADAMICTATTPKEVAWRSPFIGSIFVYCFTYMMIKLVKDAPLQFIMERVRHMVQSLTSTKDKEQVPTIRDKLNKSLYLM